MIISQSAIDTHINKTVRPEYKTGRTDKRTSGSLRSDQMSRLDQAGAAGPLRDLRVQLSFAIRCKGNGRKGERVIVRWPCRQTELVSERIRQVNSSVNR